LLAARPPLPDLPSPVVAEGRLSAPR